MADDNTRRSFRSNEPFRREAEPSRPSDQAGDPLAELARLIGRNDPFAELGRSQPRQGSQSASQPDRNRLAAERDDWQHAPAREPNFGRDDYASREAQNSYQDAYQEPYQGSHREPFQGSHHTSPRHAEHEADHGSSSDPRYGSHQDYAQAYGAEGRRQDAYEDERFQQDRPLLSGGRPRLSRRSLRRARRPIAMANTMLIRRRPARWSRGRAVLRGRCPARAGRGRDVRRRAARAPPRRPRHCAGADRLRHARHRRRLCVPELCRQSQLDAAPPVITADSSTPTKIVPASAADAQSNKAIQDRLANAGKEQVVPKQEEPVAFKELGGPVFAARGASGAGRAGAGRVGWRIDRAQEDQDRAHSP